MESPSKVDIVQQEGDLELAEGEMDRILVGQVGQSGGDAAGGSFVTKSPHNTNASILVVAGGGGGGHSNVFRAIFFKNSKI